MEHLINIENGSVYQEQKLILHNINLTIDKNELVYLIGQTGVGKSSLLKMLYGELPLKAGKGEVAGFNMATLKKKQIPLLRRKLGIVFQDFQLLTDRTVGENLKFVMGATGWKDKKSMQNRTIELLELVGLGTKINNKPFELSGGEQQRVAIARALINKPGLILADEPTGNLDSQTAQEIMQLFIAVAKEEQAAIFMATHNMTLVEKYTGRVMKVESQQLKEINSINRFNPFEPLSL